MTMLISGIVLFLGVHTFTTLREPRAALIGGIGEGPYKGLYSLVSAAGLVFIVWGFARYRADGYVPAWDPPFGLRHVTLPLMWFSFVALVAANTPTGKIRGLLRHPRHSCPGSCASNRPSPGGTARI